MKIPEKIVVYTKDQQIHVADPKNSSSLKSAFIKDAEEIDCDNIPFRIKIGTKSSYYKEFQAESPFNEKKYKIAVTESLVYDAIENCIIDKGMIVADYVWATSSSKGRPIRVGSKEYIESKAETLKLDIPLKTGDVLNLPNSFVMLHFAHLLPFASRRK